MTSRAVTAAEPSAARTSPASVSTTTASEQTAITIAFRGPTFMNVWAPPLGTSRTAVMSSSGSLPDRVVEAASPIDDVRGSAAYRRHALRVLAARALERCLRS